MQIQKSEDLEKKLQNYQRKREIRSLMSSESPIGYVIRDGYYFFNKGAYLAAIDHFERMASTMKTHLSQASKESKSSARIEALQFVYRLTIRGLENAVKKAAENQSFKVSFGADEVFRRGLARLEEYYSEKIPQAYLK